MIRIALLTSLSYVLFAAVCATALNCMGVDLHANDLRIGVNQDGHVRVFSHRTPGELSLFKHEVDEKGNFIAPEAPEERIEEIAEAFNIGKTIVESAVNGKVDTAVIAVPNSFTDDQRQLILRGSRLAGLKNARIVSKPHAAVRQYVKSGRKQLLVVEHDVDFLDISVIDIDDGVIETLGHRRKTMTHTESEATLLTGVEAAMAGAQASTKDIDGVVLVGWNPSLETFRQTLKKKFNGLEPVREMTEDELVAHGTGLICMGLDGSALETVVIPEVLPLSLGVEVDGGRIHNLLERNTPLPANATASFTTSIDHQPNAVVRIFEGERVIKDFDRQLVALNVTVERKPRGEARITVTIKVDQRLNVEVTASAGGQPKTVTAVTPTFDDETEIERHLWHAERSKAHDLRMKADIEKSITSSGGHLKGLPFHAEDAADL